VKGVRVSVRKATMSEGKSECFVKARGGFHEDRVRVLWEATLGFVSRERGKREGRHVLVFKE